MKYSLISEGTNIEDLAGVQLNPGEFVEVKLYIENVPTPEILNDIQEQLLNSGVILTSPVGYNPMYHAIVIELQQPTLEDEQLGFSPALYPVIGIVGSVLIIGGIIFSWQVSSAIGEGGLSDLWVLVGIGVVIMVLRSNAAKRTAAAAGTAARAAGKAYVDRKLFIDKDIRDEKSSDIRAQYRYSSEQAQRGEIEPSQYHGPQGMLSGGYSERESEEEDDR